ncbi:MAG TPA: hypothetical protein VNI01_05045, partial [Elusimicrobiota bacterium]|nr:hypothetical protein [Elusimicrobiota bacterium]
TLAAILADPGKTERFLSALSLLRLAVPESLPSDYAGSVREWARDAGLEFRLNELVILPASESFRRHVILVEDAEGTWGLELKMPGEDESRTWLSPAHWTLNRIFQKEFPKDHGLARAAYFGSFAGRMRLYGQLRDYGSWRENLNLALIEWSDGRRLRRGGAWLARLSREQNRPVEAIIDEARVQAAVFAARLHGRGWVGESAAGQDMHDENLRVAGDGRAELVSDFGAFHRGRMSAAARRESALRLMGYPSRAELKRIRRRVFALLKKDARPAELREARLIFDKPD